MFKSYKINFLVLLIIEGGSCRIDDNLIRDFLRMM
jgi:hypothetical protein